MSNIHDNQLIGEILQKANLVSASQIEVALKDQQRYQELNLGNLKIGEILALRGWLRKETADFFAQKWKTLLSQEKKQPIGYYLHEAALLSEQQIYYLLQEQKKLSVKLKLGELAYIEGWLNLKTIDYFVNSLYAASTEKKSLITNFSLLSEHQIITSYQQGETNFTKSNLNRIYLKDAMLKGITLDNSQLERAFLQGANLSNSSFQAVNLHKANLTQALLKNADFFLANLSQANLNKAFLESANFKNANLQQTNLENASLVKASLEGADLRGAKLQGTLFYGACYDEMTRFDSYFNPLYEGMNFVGTEFKPSSVIFV